jgi:hypothetical protein
MKIIIDRFEGSYVVCEKEDGTMINIERSKIPTEAKEGSVLSVIEDVISIDEEGNISRKKDIEEIAKDLWE